METTQKIAPMTRFVLACLLVLFIGLQIKLIFGEGGLTEVFRLKREIKAQLAHNERLSVRNAALLKDVRDLKRGKDVIEERARLELGMIKHDEVFYFIKAE